MLKDEVFRMEKHPNYMTVPAAIRELEKIEMVRGLDGRYRMDHAVTATQKDILRAFHLDAAAVKKQEEQVSIAALEEIPDGCAETFPFELIEDLRREYFPN